MARYQKIIDSPQPGGNTMRGIAAAAGVLIVLVLLGCFVWLAGSANPESPAGYMGYVTQGAVFGEAKFLKVQNGPTSYGRTWLTRVVNVSITPYTFDEIFEMDQKTAVLSKDTVPISFAVHCVMRVKPTEEGVRRFTEKYTTMHAGDESDKIVKDAYSNFIKEPLRTYAREEVQAFEALKVKENIDKISKQVEGKIVEWVNKEQAPFEIMQIAIGNIRLPDSIAAANAAYVASTVELQRLREVELPQQAAKLQITSQLAAIRVAEAKGIADSMDAINQKLTPAYIQYEAIKAQKDMISSPNHTVIYIPVGNNGVPLVGALDMGAGTGTRPGK